MRFYGASSSGRGSVPADDGDVLQHAQVRLEVAEAGTLVVGPAYGDFVDAVAALAGNEENSGSKPQRSMVWSWKTVWAAVRVRL